LSTKITNYKNWLNLAKYNKNVIWQNSDYLVVRKKVIWRIVILVKYDFQWIVNLVKWWFDESWFDESSWQFQSNEVKLIFTGFRSLDTFEPKHPLLQENKGSKDKIGKKFKIKFCPLIISSLKKLSVQPNKIEILFQMFLCSKNVARSLPLEIRIIDRSKGKTWYC